MLSEGLEDAAVPIAAHFLNDTLRKIWHCRVDLACCPNLQRITQRFDSTNFQKETREAPAHTAPACGIQWTSSFKYIPNVPNLLNSIRPFEFNRPVGLKIED